MFRGFGCSLAVAWRASILRKMRMRAKGKERRFQNAVNTVIRSLFLLAVSLFGKIIIIIIVVIIDSKTKRLFRKKKICPYNASSAKLKRNPEQQQQPFRVDVKTEVRYLLHVSRVKICRPFHLFIYLFLADFVLYCLVAL